MKKAIITLLTLFQVVTPSSSYHLPQIKTEMPLRVGIIGAGYVGLITGAGLAETGHYVVCSDIDEKKINYLNQGIMPIYEPNLPELVYSNVKESRLFFTTDVARTVQESNIVIIAVGTPMQADGRANLAYLKSAIETIKNNLKDYTVICIKSTVPIGTNQEIYSLLALDNRISGMYDLVSNPEFLREGSAIDDFFNLNPIVLGATSEYAINIMEKLYEPLTVNGTPIIKTNLASAESFKYAWNCFSAVRIMYVHELARLCNKTGADIDTLVSAMYLSQKILPTENLRPGPGIGGSCLPKDTRAFAEIAKNFNTKLHMVEAIAASNNTHKKELFASLKDMLGNKFADKSVAILGLSFKANTDDIRESPAIDLIQNLTGSDARVHAHDPQANQNMKNIIPEIIYHPTAEDAIRNTDAVVLLTDWNEYKQMNPKNILQLMRGNIIIDTRNMWNPQSFIDLGAQFINMGRQPQQHEEKDISKQHRSCVIW